ncbi:MAG: hypothetical protein MUP82_04965 [Candidatus Marinimicrobia bacterium]|nr:hypothetical protein [Candidatus Neomarinimicrobiota bacterium]
MSSQIDFRTLPANVPSLCIPRVFSNIDEKRIRRVLAELNLGDIKQVDIVGSKGQEKFNRVFIHFNKWNSNANADIARERLLNGKDIKIIYDDPWFWKVSAYREQTPHRRPVVKVAKKVSMTFDSDEGEPEKLPHRRHPHQPQRVVEQLLHQDAQEEDDTLEPGEIRED